MNVFQAINALLDYAEDNGLITEDDRIYSRNLILDVMKLDSFSDEIVQDDPALEEILAVLIRDAVSRGIIEDGVTFTDLFDTRLMNCVMPRPSEVISEFKRNYDISPQTATDHYYSFSQASDYIRTYRIRNDIKWVTKTEFGDIDMTINLSKPEKDPRAIKIAGKTVGDKYPLCLLCRENEGYAGRPDHPARENHRIIPITVNNEKWYFQYSPYVYYNEHSIFFNEKHIPMHIDREVFIKLLDIIDIFPHYFVGSNAGLPIVGGSILAHEHFQGGGYEFPMAKAKVENRFIVPGFDDVDTGIVKWPMTVIRVASADREKVIDLCDKILEAWKAYTDEEAFIFAHTDGEDHNTVTPIARKRADKYEIDLVLRNNITTDEFPDGVYHAHPEFHHIKRENIGLIEVMGLAVLPSRLKSELELLSKAILNGEDVSAIPEISKHAEWTRMIVNKHPDINKHNIDEILKEEVGLVFSTILGNCGVFKRTPEGQKQLLRFINSIKGF